MGWSTLMKKGDLVEHVELGMGIVTKTSEPTATFPVQIVSVWFTNGQTTELASTVLNLIK